MQRHAVQTDQRHRHHGQQTVMVFGGLLPLTPVCTPLNAEDKARVQKMPAKMRRFGERYFNDLVKTLANNPELKKQHQLWAGLNGQYRDSGKLPENAQFDALLELIGKVHDDAVKIRKPAVRKYGRWQPEKIRSEKGKKVSEDAQLYAQAIRALGRLETALGGGWEYVKQTRLQWAGQREDRGARFLAYDHALWSE